MAHERAAKDMEVLQQRQQKAQSDLEQQMINVAQLNSDNQNKASELKASLSSKFICKESFDWLCNVKQAF